MTDDQGLRPSITADNLSEHPLEDVLLWGLTLDEDNPALGVVIGVQQELALIANISAMSVGGPEVNVGEVAPVLERLARRLDVAIELFKRVERAAAVPSAPADPAAPEEETPP